MGVDEDFEGRRQAGLLSDGEEDGENCSTNDEGDNLEEVATVVALDNDALRLAAF